MNELLKYLRLGYNAEFKFNARTHTIEVAFYITSYGRHYNYRTEVTEELLNNPASERIVYDHIHLKIQNYIKEVNHKKEN